MTLKNPLTPKQNLFCINYLLTGSASESYRQTYDVSNSNERTIGNSGSKLMRNPQIKAKIEALTAESTAKVMKKFDQNLEGLLMELCQSREAALGSKVPQTSAAVAATMGKAKLLGLLTDKVSVSGTLNLASLIRELEQE